MDALDSVLADLVDADRDCAYATIKREPLAALIYEWARRGDQMAMLSSLLARARNQLAADHNSQPCNESREAILRALDSARCRIRLSPRPPPPRGSAGACRTTQAGFAFGNRRRRHACDRGTACRQQRVGRTAGVRASDGADCHEHD